MEAMITSWKDRERLGNLFGEILRELPSVASTLLSETLKFARHTKL